MAASELHVSRTLAPNALHSVPAKKALNVAGKRPWPSSQVSASTINSDLFPELLSWSAVMEAQDGGPSLKHVPSDVNITTDDLDAIIEDNISRALPLILDSTSIDIGFDASCLVGLDDTLLESPFAAFTDLCWSSVEDPPPPAFCSRRPLPVRPQPIEVPELTLPPESRSSCETDPESEECKTVDDVYYVPAIRRNARLRNMRAFDAPPAYEEKGTFHDLTSSFIQFEPQISVSDSKDSVGSFPVPTPRPPKGVHRRFATFCANIPTSLSLVRSAS